MHRGQPTNLPSTTGASKQAALGVAGATLTAENTMSKISPVYAGEILQDEFIEPMGLSQNRLALAVRVPARRINEIVRGKLRITADTALRLGHFFGMSPQFWMSLQARYDLDIAKDEMGSRIETEVQVFRATG